MWCMAESPTLQSGETHFTTIQGMGDGLGGTKKDKEAIPVVGGASKPAPRGNDTVDFTHISNMELEDLVEDNPWNLCNIPVSILKVTDTIPNLSPFHTNP